MVSANGRKIWFHLRFNYELERSEHRVPFTLSGRDFFGHAAGRPGATKSISTIHGKWRRMDGVPFCRIRVDAIGLSSKLGLVSQSISGLGRICQQHLAADLG